MSGNEQKAASETGEKNQAQIGAVAAKPLAGADFITSIILIIFGSAFFIIARNMRTFRVYLSSPGIFPMILGVIFILFGLVLLYNSYRRGGWADARRILSACNLKQSATSPDFKKLCVLLFLISGYVALLGRISFVYLSMGYLFLTFAYLRAAKWYWIIPISVLAPVAIHLFFSNIFRIPMP